MFDASEFVDHKDTVRIIQGDCRECRKWCNPCPPGGVIPDLAFLDPPFNIGQDYPGYVDQLHGDAFTDLIGEATTAAMEVLRPGGVLALHGPDHVADIYLNLARQRGWRRITWINWLYNFGQCQTANWVDARCHCLIYVKGEAGQEYTWNPVDVMRPSARASRYKDKRTLDSATPGVRVPGTVWGVPDDGPYWGRVQGNSKERVQGVPNQLPEVYIERLLKAYTNPGDHVLDCFGGSGTVPTVAKALGRGCTSMDISAENVAIMQQRLERGAVRVLPLPARPPID